MDLTSFLSDYNNGGGHQPGDLTGWFSYLGVPSKPILDMFKNLRGKFDAPSGPWQVLSGLGASNIVGTQLDAFEMLFRNALSPSKVSALFASEGFGRSSIRAATFLIANALVDIDPPFEMLSPQPAQRDGDHVSDPFGANVERDDVRPRLAAYPARSAHRAHVQFFIPSHVLTSSPI